jgi:hypothetical protein
MVMNTKPLEKKEKPVGKEEEKPVGKEEEKPVGKEIQETKQPSQNIDNILNDLEYYMFTSLRIESLNDKKVKEVKEVKEGKEAKEVKEAKEAKEKQEEKKKEMIIVKEKPKEEFFSPRQKDGLFWCFYVIKNGETSYELLNNEKITLVKEKKIKIDYVDVLRENKIIFKKQSVKFPSMTHIENDLVNEPIIDLGTFLSLCHLEKMNVLYVSKKTYFEMNENEGEPIHLIKCVDDPSKKTRYIYQGTDALLLEKVRSTLYKIENIEKPVKAMSAYKVADLIDFSIKLGLETTYHDEKTTKIKNKSKQALYEAVVQVI